MLGVGLALGASASWGVADLLGGVMARRVGALAVLYLSQPVGLLLALATLPFLAGSGLSLGEAGAAAGAGAFACMALGAFYRALAIGPISVVVVIAGMGVLLPVAVGLLRGEDPTALQGLGAALAIGGALLVAREPRGLHFQSASLTVVGLALIAALGFGVFFLGIDAAASSDSAWAVVAARSGGVGVLLLAWPLIRPSLRSVRPVAGPVAAVGVFDVGANGLFAVATTHGLLSLVSPAASLYSAVTVILARIFLGERVPRVRQAGIVIALAGVILIASGV